MWMSKALHRALTASVNALGHPAALLVVIGFGVLWWRYRGDSFDLHGVVTLVAVGMTIIIQRGQNRDTAALQAKLDELIKATDGARNEVAGIDDATADDIEEIRHS